MIRQTTRHRWSLCEPLMTTDQSWQSQPFVLRAEVIDTAHQVHPGLQGLALPGERARAARQAVQTTAKGAVDALNESSVDVTLALRLLDQGCDRFLRS